MTARRIFLSPAESRGLADGRVSLLVRPVTPVRGYTHNNVCRPDMAADDHAVWWHGESERVGCLQSCPFGVPGDALWGAEAHWRFTGCPPIWDGFVPSPTGNPYDARAYRDDTDLNARVEGAGAAESMSSARMPRWAARHVLTLASVRVVRVRELSPSDCCDAGCFEGGAYAMEPGIPYPVATFKAAWTARYGKRYSWDAAWAWALTIARRTEV